MNIVISGAHGHAAVVIVDVQNDYCSPGGIFDRAGLTVDDLGGLVASVNQVTGAARAADTPVVWVRMEWRHEGDVGILAERSAFLRDAGLRAGTWGVELVDGLELDPRDIHLTKRRFSAFFETELHDVLQDRDVDRLYVLGVRTDFCVESTVRDAFFRDYDVTVVADGVRGYIASLHEGSIAVMSTVFARVMNSEEVISQLQEAVPSGR